MTHSAALESGFNRRPQYLNDSAGYSYREKPESNNTQDYYRKLALKQRKTETRFEIESTEDLAVFKGNIPYLTSRVIPVVLLSLAVCCLVFLGVALFSVQYLVVIPLGVASFVFGSLALVLRHTQKSIERSWKEHGIKSLG